MAMIDKIRRQKELLLIMIGLGMLGFLIPYDAVMALIGVGGNKPAGEINGSTISRQEYQLALNERKNLFRYNNDIGLKNDVWNEFIEREVLDVNYDELGIGVTSEEFDEITFGENLSPYVKRSFYQQGADAEARKVQEDNFARMDRPSYNSYKRIIVNNRRREKFDMMVNRGWYANSLEAEYDYHFQNDRVSFEYLFIDYDNIADSLVTLSDSDVKSYYNKHKNDKIYKQETSRDLIFVSFPIEASSADITSIESQLSELKADWEKADNDTVFVSKYSKSGTYQTYEYKEGDFNGPENEAMANSPIGTVVGPFTENNSVRLVKVISRGAQPDTAATVRHILLSQKENTVMTELKAKADSIKKVIQRNNNFEEMVTKYSEDPGSKETGGKYEWFKKGSMVKPFEDASFNGAIGSLQVVETQYGYHIIEVLERRTSRDMTLLASIDREKVASSATIKKAYSDANEFAIDNNSKESFEAAADTLGLPISERKNIVPDASSMAGMVQAYEVVNWMYRSNKNDISAPIMVDGNQYVVACLTGVKEAGVPKFDDVQEEMRAAALKEKKAELYLKLMADGNNLQEIASNTGIEIKRANGISMSANYIPNTGNTKGESKVIGLAFAIPDGEMSNPIEGEGGVYVIAPTGEVTVMSDKEDFMEEQDALISKHQNNAARLTIDAMIDHANIQDDRQEF